MEKKKEDNMEEEYINHNFEKISFFSNLLLMDLALYFFFLLLGVFDRDAFCRILHRLVVIKVHCF